MAVPLALIAAGMQMAGGIMGGLEQSKALKSQAGELTRQANELERVGAQESQTIRKQGRSVVGEAVTSLASSGIVTNTGTAQEIRDYITNNAAFDAMTAVMDRSNQAYSARKQAASARRQARSAILGGLLGGGGAALGTMAAAK